MKLKDASARQCTEFYPCQMSALSNTYTGHGHSQTQVFWYKTPSHRPPGPN